jgi:hypothetical protein
VQVRTARRLRTLLTLENSLNDAAEAAGKLGRTDMQETIEQLLKQADSLADRELKRNERQ